MKMKGFILAVITILFIACDDGLNSVGTGIMPEGDKVRIYTDTIYPESKTIKIDSIFAKTVNGLLGNFSDPTFGTLKSDYICQFYTSDTRLFPDTVLNNRIDSITLSVYYLKGANNGWVGDSLAPMVASVYPVKNGISLQENYYSNVDPQKYADIKTLYGRKSYTAKDLTVSDSLYRLSSYTPSVSIKLPESLGQKIYDEWINNPGTFKELNSFHQFFPGLYVTTTSGTGNILKVYATWMQVYYKSVIQGVLVSDSAVNRVTTFNVTKEVIQLNHYTNTNDAKLLVDNPTETYIKTPAGIFTQYTIPIPEIAEKQKNRRFNSVRLSVHAFPKDEWDFSLNTPPTMLLIAKDSLTAFFERPHVIRGSATETAYIKDFSTAGYTYDFVNISRLIEEAIKNDKTKNLDIVLVPVTVATSSYTDGYSSYEIPYATYHYLSPSGVKLKKDKKSLRLDIILTDK